MKPQVLFLLTVCAAFAPGLAAQDDAEEARPAAGAGYARHSFSLGYGAAQASSMDIHFCSRYIYYNYCTPTYSFKPEAGKAFDLRYGYKPSRNLEMTVGTSIIAHDIDFNPTGSYFTNYEDRLTIGTLLVGVKGHWYPAATEKFNVYGGVEAGLALVNYEEGGRDIGAAFTLGVGTEYFFHRHFGLRLDARNFWFTSDGTYTSGNYNSRLGGYQRNGKPSEMTYGLGFIIPW